MSQDDIKKTIKSLFDSDPIKNRIIFWHDEDSEFTDNIKDMDLGGGIEIVTINKNEFQLKYRMLKEEPKKRFLVYREGPKPPDTENWLLDLEFAYGRFSADRVSQIANELGISIEHLGFLKKYENFFKEKNRKLKFQEMRGDEYDNHQWRKIMMSICAGVNPPRTDETLEAMLKQLADGKDSIKKDLEKFGLDEFLWGEVEKYYGYESENPDIEDFIISVFKSSLKYDLGQSTEAELKNSVVGFLRHWKDGRNNKVVFQELSKKYAKAVDPPYDMDYRDLIEIDYFEGIEEQILRSLTEEVETGVIAPYECEKIIEKRHNSIWFEKYKNAYKAIDYACRFLHLLENTNFNPTDAKDGIKKYTENWYQFDYLYRKFIYNYEKYTDKHSLEGLRNKVEQNYSNNYLLVLGNSWQEQVDKLQKWSGFQAPAQAEFFQRYVKPTLDKDKKIYVIISDALRYEIGHELLRRIREENRYDGELDHAVSQLPSYTQLGMAALLPHETLEFKDDNSGQVLLNGLSTAGVESRNKILQSLDKKGKAISSKDFLKMNVDESRELAKAHNFLYIYHDHIDATGDTRKSEERAFEAADKTIDEIMAIIKHLGNANANNIIVTADHGFIYQHEKIDESDYSASYPDGEEVLYSNRRFALGKNLSENDGYKLFRAEELGIKGDMQAIVPKSINRFRKQGAGANFVHGGASLQEIVIPIVKINRKRADTTDKVEVHILQGASNKITSGQHSVVLYQADPISEKLQPRTLRAALWGDGEMISDSHTIEFAGTDEKARNREKRITFILAENADKYNNKEVTLRLEENVGKTSHYETYKSTKFTIRRTFGSSDF